MDSFDEQRLLNLLPRDGCVHYYGPLMPASQAQAYFQRLWDEVAWQQDQAVIFGKKIITKRKVAWYADEAFSYTYHIHFSGLRL